jgi:hypothetical protein
VPLGDQPGRQRLGHRLGAVVATVEGRLEHVPQGTEPQVLVHAHLGGQATVILSPRPGERPLIGHPVDVDERTVVSTIHGASPGEPGEWRKTSSSICDDHSARNRWFVRPSA